MTFPLGIPIYIETKSFQRRKHRKKRINKKWLKRYGCWEINYMPHGEIVITDDPTIIHMTKRTCDELMKQIPSINKYRVN